MAQVLPPPTSSLITSLLSLSKLSSMEEEEDHKELQLLPSAKPTTSSSPWPSEPPVKFRSTASDDPLLEGKSSSVDLQLSISLMRPIIGPPPPPPSLTHFPDANSDQYSGGCVEALKWQAAEHLRLAAMERAYAERVREMTRREMELAQSVFSRARHVWERAREEVEKAERMEEMVIFRQMDSTCMEITCQSCSQKFRP